MADPLTQLQQWYLSNCNGDWEHTYGVSIGTLDNPGWSVKIELTGTPCDGRDLARKSVGATTTPMTRGTSTGLPTTNITQLAAR